MNTVENTIRNNVKNIRTIYGYTQETIANALGISLSSYQKLEQGQRKFTLEHLINISNFLNVELPTLLRTQTTQDDILNQSVRVRKEFLIELLKTFSIGCGPQEEYTVSEISALLSFIRIYGHTVTYAPERLRSQLLYDGKIHSKNTERIEELEAIYARGIPEQYKQINELLTQETEIRNRISALQEEESKVIQAISRLNESFAAQKTPEINNLERLIASRQDEIQGYEKECAALQEQISTLQSNVSSERKRLSAIQGQIIGSEITLDKMNQLLESVKEQYTKVAPSDIEKIEAYNSELLGKIAELEKKLADTEDEISQIYDQYDDDVSDEVDRTIQENLDEYREEWNYEIYNFTGEDIEDMTFTLLKYMCAFIELSSKYKTAPKNIESYIKHTRMLIEGIDYSNAADEKYLFNWAKQYVDWKNTYGRTFKTDDQYK